MKWIYCIALICSCFTPSHIYAQGCSDAGFCTAGAMQSGQKANDTIGKRNIIGFSLTVGSGENGTTILAPQIEGKFYLSPNTYIEGKFPFNIASGNLGAHNAIGDPIVICSHYRDRNSHVKFITSVGARIGIANANATDNGKALPMPYQSSLGTSDLIVGLGAFYGKHLSASAGFQQPLLQYNRNSYLPTTIYPKSPNDHEYFASKDLKRKGDILIRVEGHYEWKKISISAGPLLIYHLGEDTYTTTTGNRASLYGSSGTTLNMVASMSYIMKAGRIDIQGGAPMIVRSYRPDGLTRSFALTLRYTKVK